MDQHLHLVYSAALRRLGDPDAARDVTQSVFCLLAKKARRLNPRMALVGWLYQTACFKASYSAAMLNTVLEEKTIQAAPAWAAEVVRAAAFEAARAASVPSLLTTSGASAGSRRSSCPAGSARQSTRNMVMRSCPGVRRRVTNCWPAPTFSGWCATSPLRKRLRVVSRFESNRRGSSRKSSTATGNPAPPVRLHPGPSNVRRWEKVPNSFLGDATITAWLARRLFPGAIRTCGREPSRTRNAASICRSVARHKGPSGAPGGDGNPEGSGGPHSRRNCPGLLSGRCSMRSCRLVVAGAARGAGLLVRQWSGTGPAGVRGGSRNALCLQGVSALLCIRRSFGCGCGVVTLDGVGSESSAGRRYNAE
jgi:hypothetical protein